MRCPTSLYAVVPHGPHKDKLRLAEPIKWSMYLPSRPIPSGRFCFSHILSALKTKASAQS